MALEGLDTMITMCPWDVLENYLVFDSGLMFKVPESGGHNYIGIVRVPVKRYQMHEIILKFFQFINEGIYSNECLWYSIRPNLSPVTFP